MPLQVVSIDEKETWDQIVYSFKKYDVYYLSGYARTFQINGDGEPLLIHFSDGESRAIQVVMKRDISEVSAFKNIIMPNALFDLTTPYGYGGFIWEGRPNWTGLNVAFTKYCLDENVVSEFVRFHPVLETANGANKMYAVTQRGVTVAIDLSSPELIWNGFTSENRNMIRKAQKNNILVMHSTSEPILKRFQEIYTKTMLRDNAKEYYYFKNSFYENLSLDLHDNYLIFYACKEGIIIAASIIMFANKQMHYHLSGSLMEYRKYAPTNLLLYEASIWGCEHGYKTFHLGGGIGGKEDSLYRFKKEFNRYKSSVFCSGQRVYDWVKYQKLINIEKNDNVIKDMEYFPLYRA